MTKKAVKKTSKKVAKVDFEPTMVALVVAFVAAISILLFAILALSFR